MTDRNSSNSVANFNKEPNEAGIEAVQQLSVATYNVHLWVGQEGRTDPDRVLSVIREMNADIVALQEAGYPEREEEPYGVDYISRITNRYVILGPTLKNNKGHFGNMLLTRYPVSQICHINLSVANSEPRGALNVCLDVHGTSVRVIATHLGLKWRERRYQLRRLLKHATEDTNQMLILMGDFNVWSPLSKLFRQIEHNFGKTPALRTYPAFFPLFRLDRIWVRPRGALVHILVHQTPSSKKASDHLPVKAVIALNGNPLQST